MDKRKKEIRRILSGMITSDPESGIILAAHSLNALGSQGMFLGAEGAGLFGVRTQMRQFRFEGGVQETCTRCVRAFETLGQLAWLLTAPEALTALCRTYWRSPVVITAEIDPEKKQLLVCTYTARNLLSGRRLRRTARKLDEVLPRDLHPVSLTMSPACVDPETGGSGEKKAAKEKKKRERKKPDTAGNETKK